RGHVARLPKVLRDKVNTMLDDGATYPDIAAELQKSTNPPLPHPVSDENIRRWFEGGYQDYLRNQTWGAAIRASQEKTLEAIAEDPVKFADAGVQLAATGICELLDELARAKSDDAKAPDQFARIANSMARLARVILAYADRRHALDKEKATELKQLDPNRELEDTEHLAIVDHVNRLFGLRQYRKPGPEERTSARASEASTGDGPTATVA
ncbi:MAG: hypothetical protein JWO95_3313, partial [Verrucomicrobiales bacterium]|nr:hypothetical protein [Verrucomicrobiales bacterium]